MRLRAYFRQIDRCTTNTTAGARSLPALTLRSYSGRSKEDDTRRLSNSPDQRPSNRADFLKFTGSLGVASRNHLLRLLTTIVVSADRFRVKSPLIPSQGRMRSMDRPRPQKY